MTAAEVRTQGDATADQRAELRHLIQQREVDPAWLKRFYSDVKRAGGLTRATANDKLIYLRSLALRGERPTTAIPAQGEALRALIRTRVIPTRIATLFTSRFTSGDLTYIEADRAIREWLRLPLREFVLLDNPPGGTTVDAPDGYFALMAPDGLPRCYRIHTLPGSGRQVVDQITGERRSQRRRLVGYKAKLVLLQVAADEPAAARLYARTRRRCSACNLPLEDEKQPGYQHGYGLHCWEEKQAAAQRDAT